MKQIASERVGKNDWRVEFARVARRVWEFEAYKTGEARSGKPNLFWSEEQNRFMAPSRLDVPPTVIERTVAWILHSCGGRRAATR
jgi:hypothetical protein